MTEWQAFHALEPWGFRQEWLRFGAVLAMIRNLFRKKGSPALGARDFVPKDPTLEELFPRKQTTADHLGALRGIAWWARKHGKLKEKTGER